MANDLNNEVNNTNVEEIKVGDIVITIDSNKKTYKLIDSAHKEVYFERPINKADIKEERIKDYIAHIDYMANAPKENRDIIVDTISEVFDIHVYELYRDYDAKFNTTKSESYVRKLLDVYFELPEQNNNIIDVNLNDKYVYNLEKTSGDKEIDSYLVDQKMAYEDMEFNVSENIVEDEKEENNEDFYENFDEKIQNSTDSIENGINNKNDDSKKIENTEINNDNTEVIDNDAVKSELDKENNNEEVTSLFDNVKKLTIEVVGKIFKKKNKEEIETNKEIDEKEVKEEQEINNEEDAKKENIAKSYELALSLFDEMKLAIKNKFNSKSIEEKAKAKEEKVAKKAEIKLRDHNEEEKTKDSKGKVGFFARAKAKVMEKASNVKNRLTRKSAEKEVAKNIEGKTTGKKIKKIGLIAAALSLTGLGVGSYVYNTNYVQSRNTQIEDNTTPGISDDDKTKEESKQNEETAETKDAETENETKANEDTEKKEEVKVGIGTKVTLDNEKYFETASGTGKYGVMSDKDKEVTISRIAVIDNGTIMTNADNSNATIEEFKQAFPNAKIKVHIVNKDSVLGWIDYDSIKDKVVKEQEAMQKQEVAKEETKATVSEEKSNSNVEMSNLNSKDMNKVFKEKYKYSVSPVDMNSIQPKFEKTNENTKEI